MSSPVPFPNGISVVLGTFGEHVDGAPLTYAVLNLNTDRARRLLALIADFNADVAAGRINRPVHRPAAPAEIDLVPQFIPRRATQRKPHYTIFQQARLDLDDLLRAQLHDRALLAHIDPVGRKREEIIIAWGSLSFCATQAPVERMVFSNTLHQDTLYIVLAMLTPARELPALLEAMATKAPNAFLRLLSDEPVPFFTTEGRREFRLPETVRLDAVRVARMMEVGSPDVRERMVERLSGLLDRGAPDVPAAAERTRAHGR